MDYFTTKNLYDIGNQHLQHKNAKKLASIFIKHDIICLQNTKKAEAYLAREQQNINKLIENGAALDTRFVGTKVVWEKSNTAQQPWVKQEYHYDILPLAWAIENKKHDIAEKIIQAGANLDTIYTKNNEDVSFMKAALDNKDEKMANLLLDHGYQPTKFDMGMLCFYQNKHGMFEGKNFLEQTTPKIDLIKKTFDL